MIINNKSKDDYISFTIIRDNKEKEVKSKIYIENNQMCHQTFPTPYFSFGNLFYY